MAWGSKCGGPAQSLLSSSSGLLLSPCHRPSATLVEVWMAGWTWTGTTWWMWLWVPKGQLSCSGERYPLLRWWAA